MIIIAQKIMKMIKLKWKKREYVSSDSSENISIIDEKSENYFDILVEKLNNFNCNENNNLTKYNTNEDYLLKEKKILKKIIYMFLI